MEHNVAGAMSYLPSQSPESPKKSGKKHWFLESVQSTMRRGSNYLNQMTFVHQRKENKVKKHSVTFIKYPMFIIEVLGLQWINAISNYGTYLLVHTFAGLLGQRSKKLRLTGYFGFRRTSREENRVCQDKHQNWLASWRHRCLGTPHRLQTWRDCPQATQPVISVVGHL